MTLQITLLLSVIVLIFTFNGVYLYLLYIKLEDIERHLTTATWIPTVKDRFSSSPWANRTMRLNAIFLVMVAPSVLVGRGEIQAHEIAKIPKRLRRLVLTTLAMGVAVAVILISFYVKMKLLN